MKHLAIAAALIVVLFTSCQKESLTPDQDRIAFIKSTSFKVTSVVINTPYIAQYTVISWDYFYSDKLELTFQAPSNEFVAKYQVGSSIKGKELLKGGLVK